MKIQHIFKVILSLSINTCMKVNYNPITGGYSKVMFKLLHRDSKISFHSLTMATEMGRRTPTGVIKVGLNSCTKRKCLDIKG